MQFRSVTLLGLLGLVPFFFFTIFILIYPENIFALRGLHLYAAVVLSFLGGIHWGLLAQARSMGQTDPMHGYWIWSVMPPLVAWVVIWWPPIWLGFAILTLMYIAQYIVDVRLTKLSILPYWLLQLRRILTSLAMICFIIVLIRIW